MTGSSTGKRSPKPRTPEERAAWAAELQQGLQQNLTEADKARIEAARATRKAMDAARRISRR